MTPTPNGRDGQGRFAPGNPGGPGNPNARTAQRWRERLADIVTNDDFDAIIRRMVADAIAGDKDARSQLLDRLCGKPAPIRDEPEPEETKLIFIRRLLESQPPPGSVPALPDDASAKGDGETSVAED